MNEDLCRPEALFCASVVGQGGCRCTPRLLCLSSAPVGQVLAAGVVNRQLNVASAERPLRHLRALIAHYTTAQFDAHFEYGLSALLADARRTVPA